MLVWWIRLLVSCCWLFCCLHDAHVLDRRIFAVCVVLDGFPIQILRACCLGIFFGGGDPSVEVSGVGGVLCWLDEEVC